MPIAVLRADGVREPMPGARIDAVNDQHAFVRTGSDRPAQVLGDRVLLETRIWRLVPKSSGSSPQPRRAYGASTVTVTTMTRATRASPPYPIHDRTSPASTAPTAALNVMMVSLTP